MKRFLTLLCMLTCILSFTACGSETKESEHQKELIQNAQISAYVDTSMFVYMLENPDMLPVDFSEYTAEEIEYICANDIGISTDGNAFLSVKNSFELNADKTGKITIDVDQNTIGDLETIVDDRQIIVHVPVTGSKQNAEVELIFSNDMFMKLEGGALNPKATFGDLMGKAALNTLIGMSTVFMVLILISLIIACFGIIPKIQKAFTKKEKEEVNVTGIDNAVAQINKQEEILEEESDDLELVAVISAAIAAYEGTADASGYVVRSIRKINR